MSSRVESVNFVREPGINEGDIPESIIVEQLTKATMDEAMGFGILSLMAQSYRQQLGHVNHLASPESVDKTFNPLTGKVNPDRYAKNVAMSMDEGDEYWIMGADGGQSESDKPVLRGFIHVTPRPESQPKKRRFSRAPAAPVILSARIETLCILPEDQKKRYGSVLFYAGLRYSQHDFGNSANPTRVLAPVFVGNKEPNAWLARIGLKDKSDDEILPFKFDATDTKGTVERELYVTPFGHHGAIAIMTALLKDLEAAHIEQEAVIRRQEKPLS